MANKSIIGVDIGTHTIKLVALSGIGKPNIFAFSEVELPENTISPHGLSQKDKVVVSLKSAILNSSLHKIHPKFVCSSLPESSVFTKVISMPKMNLNEMKKAIDGQIVEILPRPREEMEIDYQILGSTEEQTDFLLVAAEKTLVADMLDIFSQVNIELIRLDTKPAALGRLIVGNGNKPLVVVDIGARSSSISIYDWGQIKITSTLATGGDQWAEDVKKQEKGEVKQVRAEEYLSTITTITEEIQSTIDYYQKRSISARPIEQIMLAGGGSQLVGIEKVIEERIEIPTIIATSNIYLPQGVDNRFFVAIGSVLDPPI